MPTTGGSAVAAFGVSIVRLPFLRKIRARRAPATVRDAVNNGRGDPGSVTVSVDPDTNGLPRPRATHASGVESQTEHTRHSDGDEVRCGSWRRLARPR